MNNAKKHYEESEIISASAKELFAFIDDHKRFSSHMSKSSWMLAGGKMQVFVDKGNGQKVGSHIRLNGKVLGINLFLDEVVMRYKPPYHKAWQTVGDLNLVIISHYQMEVEIKPGKSNSKLKISIDYELPKSNQTRWLGYLFGDIYAKWCVRQMINGVKGHFKK